MTAAVLSIANLAISFHQYERGLRRRTVTPVVDMSLTAYAGEVLAVVGASGAGKSLVGLATMGLLPPNATESGSIRFRGTLVTTADRRRLAGREMTLLPQSGSFLDPLARVDSQLRRAARLAGLADPAATARAVLERRGLPARTGRLYPHQLSGGMTRRVLFGMATLARPALVFADEPTPGLHPASVAEVLADIRGLADDGAAVVLVTHGIDQALTIADRVVVCRAGRTIEEATPARFHDSALREPYSRALWQALPSHGFRLPDELDASEVTR
ncbi:ATP-binding cassette domain-containing protein [Asanoa siamensis]|uniref:Nickel import system ATP-binding protein NikD n=1 Tax=Asanoa siamensis TaxID=926357 RepID=A0ABQ4D124_9ACTN|nr:ATP-binding cassette domain-containing protein [Asanoa siamensis]GIF77223.1 ABC transporter ATP-binding protein [Asanoa siamensis]